MGSFAQMQFGRIAYWTSKCKAMDGALDQFVGPLLDRFLDDPSKYIDSLHDVCDNAPEDRMTDLLRLLHRLRDMYLCRYDLQRADIENERRKNTFNKSKAQSTPFSSGRGHLMDALSKPTNAQNRRLKKISDSFDIGDFDQMDED